MVSRIKDNEKAKRNLERLALESEHGLMFAAYIGGELDNVVTCLEENRTTEYQMIQLMIALKETLEELIKQHTELYAVALNELPETESILI